jgi:hypothetical protein
MYSIAYREGHRVGGDGSGRRAGDVGEIGALHASLAHAPLARGPVAAQLHYALCLVLCALLCSLIIIKFTYRGVKSDIYGDIQLYTSYDREKFADS